MSEDAIASLSFADIVALRSRWRAEQERRDRELRYLLVAITGNKSLLKKPTTQAKSVHGPDTESMQSNLDRSAMEFSKRLETMGI